MRILAATINFDHPQLGVSQALRDLFGVANVTEFDFYQRWARTGGNERAKLQVNKDLIDAAFRTRPDWIWLQVQDTGIIQSGALKKIREQLPGTVITHWTGDCRPSISLYLSSICQVTDVTFVSSVGQLPMFRAAGAQRAEYLQIGLDWEEDVLGVPHWTPPFKVPAVVFCGSYYGSTFGRGTDERVAAIKALQAAKIEVGIVGSGWPRGFPVVGSCAVKQQHHVWKRALVGLNVNHFNDIELYYSDRQLIAMASGTPLVCRYVPGLEREFMQGEHCLWYTTEKELIEHVFGLLGDEERRAAMGKAARDLVIDKHTWIRRFEQACSVAVSIRSPATQSAAMR